jgi:thiol-disulfide isomerase/thioredoxin
MQTMTFGRRTFVYGAALLAGTANAARAEAPALPTIKGQKDLERALAETTAPLVVDLWATWCAPCKKFGPVFDAVAGSGKFSGVSFARLDVGPTSGHLWQTASFQYHFTYIPSVVLFAPGGRYVSTATGGVSEWSEWKLRDWLKWKLPEAQKN